MIKRIPAEDKNIFAFQAIGKLTQEDYQEFLPQLEELIRKHGRISMLVELIDFEGWEPKAAWEDFRFGMTHDRDFDRIAIVGDSKWEKAMVALANLVSRTRMRFFQREDIDQAWEWLEAAVEQEQPQPPQPYRKLLLATDFSPFSKRAGLRARELAERYGARLVVAHALEDPTVWTGEYDPLMIEPAVTEEMEAEAMENLRIFARELNLPDNTDLQIIWGSPKWALLSLAREKAVDAIVVGTHGRGGFDRLLGSVSTSIMHRSPCDVIVVR